jgi:hypothetical protein
LKSENGRTHSPLTGGYYWFPTQPGDPVVWSVLTCHDLGFGPDEGHFDMWPSVIDRLASAWRRDRRRLKRLLSKHCYGLPRGRVTRPDRQSLVLHGHDAPVADWLERVVDRFDLDRRSLKPLYDEHETMMGEDRCQVAAALGLASNPAATSIPEEPHPR